ncbi:hypothetical protein R69658_07843 [Paraburkholderia aspalathi]|uniref:Uncharacterized protein n=1 Tax=Paraburkholderia aspalathi TaxID=1324617 RepID=A0ABM8T7V7_9BURK|nr:hypothetical protein [Paraburkholderia aspalathi]MBK3824109.1 hypothetical protein [Paraburkholderia aspalathi]MBK3835951.1 hypothetical protein [Paraburkholderia aspalathi]MBK3865727.1 hypothetical protein [Paraburkholderia aspalathi]CAE6865580.1 hypothetical protein R69658_07843 [Paraburkholderia aspalathi]
MTKSKKKAAVSTSQTYSAEVNRADAGKAGVRISDAMELLDSLIWAADQAISQQQYDMVLSLLRASLPSVGAALEAANDALGECRIGRYVYSNDVSAGGAVLEVFNAHA